MSIDVADNIPERVDVFFQDWWGTPLPIEAGDLTSLSPEQANALINANIREWLRLAYKAGYRKAQFLYGLEPAKEYHSGD